MSEALTCVTDDSFQSEVLQSELPTLVDFWAEWCGPCKGIAPFLDALAEEYKGRVNIVKCDVAANKATPSKYNVLSIPTLMLFKDGNPIATHIGASDVTKSFLSSFIDGNL